MSFNPSFWTLLAFVSLVSLVGKRGWQTLRTHLDQRAEDINSDINAAQRLKDEAQIVLDQARQLQKEMNARSEDIIAHSDAEILRLKFQAQQDLDSYLAYEKDQLATRLQHLESQAIQHFELKVVDIAFATAQHVMKDQGFKTTHDLLFDKGISEISRIPQNCLSS